MADISELRGFARLEGAVGGVSALKLCAFFGGQVLHVPTSIDRNHVLSRLIGETDAAYLVQELGGEDCWIPACEMKSLRRAGRLRTLTRQGKSATACAGELGVTGRQARRIAQTLLRLEGYDETLASP